MSRFNVQNFAADPSAELSSIQYAKKQELFELASHLTLATRTNMRRPEILNLILEHYVRVGRLNIDEAKQYIIRESVVLTPEQQLEHDRIALEKFKIEARERESEARKLESEREIEARKFEIEARKLESETRKFEIEARKFESERQAEREIEARKFESDRELEKMKLEFEVEKARMKEKLEMEKQKL